MANVDYIVEYDRSDPISIETYSQKMVGKTFREIREADEARRPMISPGNDADADNVPFLFIRYGVTFNSTPAS